MHLSGSSSNGAALCWHYSVSGLAKGGRRAAVAAQRGGEDIVLQHQVPKLAPRSNKALVSDVCAAALRASYNAPQRRR
jgi:hypothetical protein